MPIPASIHNQLNALAKDCRQTPIISLFEEGDRVGSFNFDLGPFQLDLSKTHITPKLVDAYTALAKDIGLLDRRAEFLSGERINLTENRPVLHTLLRQSKDQFHKNLPSKFAEQAVEARLSFQQQINTIRKKLDNEFAQVSDLIHVGIGGSSLGTQLVCEALKGLDSRHTVHFVSNIDGHQLQDVLSQCTPSSTLVFGISKTFGTAETLQNVSSILAWLHEGGVETPLSRLYAVTAKPEAARQYGVAPDNIVAFPEWVGGRYSVWSSVSMSAALCLGEQRFEEFLSGAAHIDAHFSTADPRDNLPFLAACLDHFYTNYLDTKSRAIFAYDHRLRSLVPYLQQLETESNGKDRQKSGQPVVQSTSPVVWGGVGTDVQHSVFQMMHQGTSLIPVEFILVVRPDHDLEEHHKILLANGIAQSAALLLGQSLEEVQANEPGVANTPLVLNSKIFSGNRPSSTFLLDKLTPYALGALLAFYEHRTFCFGLLVNINSFDQMGVELGKRLANTAADHLNYGGNGSTSAHIPKKQKTPFDPSTQAILDKVNDALSRKS